MGCCARLLWRSPYSIMTVLEAPIRLEEFALATAVKSWKRSIGPKWLRIPGGLSSIGMFSRMLKTRKMTMIRKRIKIKTRKKMAKMVEKMVAKRRKERMEKAKKKTKKTKKLVKGTKTKSRKPKRKNENPEPGNLLRGIVNWSGSA